MTESAEFVLYAVRNHEGRYYKTYSNSGSGRGWQKDLAKAKIYVSSSQAQSTVTRLANESPELPVPELVAFQVTEIKVIDQQNRVAESRLKKQEADAHRKAAYAAARIKDAEEDVKRAQLELENARAASKPLNKDYDLNAEYERNASRAAEIRRDGGRWPY